MIDRNENVVVFQTVLFVESIVIFKSEPSD